MTPAPPPPDRSPLALDEVVRAALTLLDEVGLDGLTMRSLAERLGVKAASLYWHLRDKDELQDLMVEAINAELPDPDPALAWRESLERQAWAWRALLLRHRDAARLVMGRLVTLPNTLRQVEHVLATLRRAGFNDQDVADAAYLFSTFVPGFVAEEAIPRGPAHPEPPSPLTGEGQGGAAADQEHRLEIQGANRLTLDSDPGLTSLYRVEAEGRQPEVQTSQGIVSLRTHGRRACALTLNATVAWTIRVRGGASRLNADLRGIRLTSLQITGGASGVDLVAPPPLGTVSIEVSGGASRLAVHRPPEVPVRVEARGGVSRLLFDRRRSPSAGELTVQSPGYDRAEDRLAVSIDGGASKVTIDDEMPASPAAPARPGPEATARSRPPAGAGGQDEYPTLDSLSPLLAQTSMDDRFRFGLTVILDGMERRLPPGVQKR